jgi:signal transduction histidine kinase/DNA-binding NarL/FixJ family response regulator
MPYKKGGRFIGPLAAFLFAVFFPAVAAAAVSEWPELFEVAQANPQDLIQRSDKILREARESGDKTGELKALEGLSVAHQFLFELSPLKQEAERGVALARELGNPEATCFFLHYKALAMYDRGSKDAEAMLAQATELFSEAIDIAEKNHLALCMPWIHLSKGKIFNAVRRTSDSLQEDSKAYTLFEAAGDSFGMASALNSIAAYSLIQNSVQDAEKIRGYLERSMELADTKVYRVLTAENYLLHGHNYSFLKDLRTARASFENAAGIAREVHYFTLLGLAERELAELDKEEKRYDSALDHIDKALPLLKMHPDGRHYIKGMLLRADVLAKLGRTPECLKMLADAASVLAQMDDPSSAALYHSRAASLYVEMDNYYEAYRQLEKLRKMDERLNVLRNQSLADELKVRFDVKLKESENARLLAESQQAESRRLSLLLGLALTVVISLALFGAFGMYYRKRSADVRTEIAHQKRLAEAEAAANQAKSDFLANMSHELRSPLNAILGFARIVARDSGLPSDARSKLDIVVKSGEHLFQLINQILDLSKIEAGRMALNDSVYDLYGLLDELEKMFSLTARQKGLALVFEQSVDLPRYIRVDAGKLRQILINLLSNAFKFTRQGSVTLRVDKRGEERLSFSITDTGPGIASDELEELGRPFVQAHEGRKSREGTGLGLAICNRFIKLMGGELKLASVQGKGSTFTFDINAPEVGDDDALALPSLSSERVVGLAPGQPRYRILATDDLADQRHLVASLLTPLGFEVREASNGEEAIAVWEEWAPHLIWMDMRMPVLNGREATRRIKSTEKGKSTIIIALTASTFEDEIEEVLGAGCDDFLRKPFQEQALFEMLSKHLGVRFIHEQPVNVQATPQPADPARIAALPADLLERLSVALAGLEVDDIGKAIEEIRAIDPQLAESLSMLSATFDFGQMLALLPAQQ